MLNFVQSLILIGHIKCLDTLNATQKKKCFKNTIFEKIKTNCQKLEKRRRKKAGSLYFDFFQKKQKLLS